MLAAERHFPYDSESSRARFIQERGSRKFGFGRAAVLLKNGWCSFTDLKIVKDLIGRREQVLNYAAEVYFDPSKQHQIAAELLSDT